MIRVIKMKIVCGTLLDSDKFLIGQRLEDNPSYGGFWELPGGKIDDGESPDDAIKREWKEELDIEINPYYLIPERDINGVMVYPYFIKYKSGKPTLNVHQRVKWITLKEIGDYNFTPITKKTLYIIKGSYSLFLNKEAE